MGLAVQGAMWTVVFAGIVSFAQLLAEQDLLLEETLTLERRHRARFPRRDGPTQTGVDQALEFTVVRAALDKKIAWQIWHLCRNAPCVQSAAVGGGCGRRSQRSTQSPDHVDRMSAMNTTGPLSDVAHIIELAIAPVFVLTAVATIISVLTGRLARAVDRWRSLATALPTLQGPIADLARQEYDSELRRGHVICTAIAMAVTSALLVAVLICVAFIDAFVSVDLGKLVAVLFILSMVALMLSLGIFLCEIFFAMNSPRAPIP
jgi:hypothetical protein